MALALLVLLAACGAAPGTIGAALGKRPDGRLFVRGMPPEQGAAKAGLEIDDEILSIDGKDVAAMSEIEVRKAVRGDVGTTMTLVVVRDGVRTEIKVVRSPLLAEKKK